MTYTLLLEEAMPKPDTFAEITRFRVREDVDLRLVDPTDPDLRRRVSRAWEFTDSETGLRCFPVASGGWFACDHSGCAEGHTWQDAIEKGKQMKQKRLEAEYRHAALYPVVLP